MAKRDDPELLNAVSVLVDAVRRERIPGVVEFRQLEDALKDISTLPTDNSWATADAAFKALDPDLRQRVADRAQQLAYKEAKTRRGEGLLPPAQNAAPPVSATDAIKDVAKEVAKEITQETLAPPAKAPPKAAASPFLTALNRGKLGAR